MIFLTRMIMAAAICGNYRVVGYDDDDFFSTLPERVKQELSQYRTEVSDSSELRRLAEKIMLRY